MCKSDQRPSTLPVGPVVTVMGSLQTPTPNSTGKCCQELGLDHPPLSVKILLLSPNDILCNRCKGIDIFALLRTFTFNVSVYLLLVLLYETKAHATETYHTVIVIFLRRRMQVLFLSCGFFKQNVLKTFFQSISHFVTKTWPHWYYKVPSYSASFIQRRQKLQFHHF